MKSTKKSTANRVSNLLVIDYANVRSQDRYSWKDITPQEVISRLTSEKSPMYLGFLRHMTPSDEPEVFSELQRSITQRLSGQKLGRDLYQWIKSEEAAEGEEIDDLTIDYYLTSEEASDRFKQLKKLVKNNSKKLQAIALEATREAVYDAETNSI